MPWRSETPTAGGRSTHALAGHCWRASAGWPGGCHQEQVMTRYAVPGPPVQLPDGRVSAVGLPQHGGVAVRAVIDDAQPPARAHDPCCLAQRLCAPAASPMLEIARLLTTRSNDADPNGRSRASASITSTRPRTPSATALRLTAARLLPLWSRRRQCPGRGQHRWPAGGLSRMCRRWGRWRRMRPPGQ